MVYSKDEESLYIEELRLGEAQKPTYLQYDYKYNYLRIMLYLSCVDHSIDFSLFLAAVCSI